MTQDEIIEMAKEAGFWQDLSIYQGLGEHFKAFAKLVAAKERERYIPLLTELAHIVRTSHLYGPEMKKLLEQEEAIRARGEA